MKGYKTDVNTFMKVIIFQVPSTDLRFFLSIIVELLFCRLLIDNKQFIEQFNTYFET